MTSPKKIAQFTAATTVADEDLLESIVGEPIADETDLHASPRNILLSPPADEISGPADDNSEPQDSPSE